MPNFEEDEMQLAMRIRDQLHNSQIHNDSNVSRLGRKRDEKRDRKLDEREEIKTSSIMGPPLPISRNYSSQPTIDAASYTHYVDKCFECFSKDLVTKTREGTIVCQNCGLVQQQRIIDESSEWRTFSSETANSGANPSRVGGKLNPYLSNYGIDTQVKGVNASEFSRWSDRSTLSAKDKQITKGMRAIKDMATRLNLKEPAVNKAYEIYKQIEDKGIKGVSVTAKVATVVFIASRIEK